MNNRNHINISEFIPRDLWFVTGVKGEYFTNRLAAEVRARKAFPSEDTYQNHKRVFHKRLYERV
jgi:hypothetical protein